jgi:propionate catabolism operon transcriptional regulator
LLRVLQEKEVVRVGATESTAVDVRVIAATNKNLKEATETGSFRRDLFYRINILQIALPALREREGDIWSIAVDMLRHALSIPSDKAETILQPWREYFLRYPWPGNVRELQNIIQRIAAHHRDNTRESHPGIFLRDIAPELFADHGERESTPTLKGLSLQKERELITRVLDSCTGDKDQACRCLGISRSTLWRRMREWSTQ